MDPQQRLLLEVTWEALETPASRRRYSRHPYSVFVGMTTYDYTLTLAGDAAGGGRPARPVRKRVELRSGRSPTSWACMVRWFAGYRVFVVAGHHAPGLPEPAQRDSDQALVGGVNLMLSPENSIATSRWGCWLPTAAAGPSTPAPTASPQRGLRSRGAQAADEAVPTAIRYRGGARVSCQPDGPSSGQTVPSGPAQQAVLVRRSRRRGWIRRTSTNRGARHRHRVRRSDRSGRAAPGFR